MLIKHGLPITTSLPLSTFHVISSKAFLDAHSMSSLEKGYLRARLLTFSFLVVLHL
jgi:hypothetical protein